MKLIGENMEENAKEILTVEQLLNEFDDVVVAKGGIPRQLWGENCPQSLREEIDALPDKVNFQEIGDGKVRLENGDEIFDLRHLDFITVDPKGCKDMDDAVCCQVNENGDYVVYTAIADVPRYFDLPESLNDIDACDSIGKVYLKGGYTMYSCFKAYGILPDKLSDDLCSLKEGEDRLAFVTKMTISHKTGRIIQAPEILEGVIRSRAKLSYNEAEEIVENGESAVKNNPSITNRVEQQVILGRVIADTVIHQNFVKRDMVKVPDEEKPIVTLKNGKFKVEKQNHLAYQDVIEAFMILTNEVNARFAKIHNIDGIYRIHEDPSVGEGKDTESLAKLLECQPLYGFDRVIDPIYPISPKVYNELFALAKNDGEKNELYRRFLSRIQKRAKSSLIPYQQMILDGDSGEGKNYAFSHFGLQSEYYMHITSPIRRITDYVNIRNILAYVQGKAPLSRNLVEQIAYHADERRAEVDNAESGFRDIVASHYYKNQSFSIFAKLCDFDFKNKECIFEDENTGFKIRVSLDEFTGGLYVDQEKWGVLLNGDILACLGQKKEIYVTVEKDMSVRGFVANTRINSSSYIESEEGDYGEDYHSKKKQKVKNKWDNAHKDKKRRSIKYDEYTNE